MSDERKNPMFLAGVEIGEKIAEIIDLKSQVAALTSALELATNHKGSMLIVRLDKDD